MPSSLFQRVLVSLQFSDGGVSYVRVMKVARAGLTMVTFLSWMVNARDEFSSSDEPWSGTGSD